MSPPLRLRPLSLGIALAGSALTVALAWTSAAANHSSNHRLLQLQVRQAASALVQAEPSVQSQMDDALEVATDTGKPAAFKRFGSQKVGGGGSFASLSLWQRTSAAPKLLGYVGLRPEMAGRQATAFFAQLRPEPVLQVFEMANAAPARLQYAMTTSGSHGLVVYAESLLPAHRRVAVSRQSAFNDLNFAIYFGDKAVPAKLMVATAPTPLRGPSAMATVPFGSAAFTMVATSEHQLAGGLSAALEWIVLGVGCALAMVTAATVEYVLRRRRIAEDLAAENERLYVEQRDIAITLQHALLPELPHIPGVELAARYLAGVHGIEVGGDWYDVITCDNDRFYFVVGDVSGRGLGAATTMASLRYATRAYIADGTAPAQVLQKLSSLLDFGPEGRFATVMIGEVDLGRGRLTLANAGHLPPLLMGKEGSTFIEVPTGTPVGIAGPARPDALEMGLAPGTLVLVYTDGLVERRGEDLGLGLDRLQMAATALGGADLESMLDQVTAALIPQGADDDIVVLGIRAPAGAR